MKTKFPPLQTAVIALSLALAGCWTFKETPYPSAKVTKAPNGKSVTVAVNGLATTFIGYLSIISQNVVTAPPTHHGWMHSGMMTTTSYVPQVTASDMFLKRARDAFEMNGFNIGAAAPDWIVEVDFSGPYRVDGDALYRTLWFFGTLTFCDYNAHRWTARLKIRNNRDGRLAFSRDYEQVCETHAASIIPLFGIAQARNTEPNYLQSWCLAALTDRAVADATAFLADKP